MTFYSDLQTEIETKIEAEYSATLAAIGDGVPFDLSLPELLKLRDYLRSSSSGAIEIIGVADGEPVGINNAHVMHNESQLSAPSSTSSRNMNGFNRAFITATVANINTNVVLRIEGSNDNSNWVNLSASDADTTITANGTYGFQYVGCPQHIRTTFVSESGGTSATVDVITRLSA